jgi:cytoplasmic tyrosine-protein kinase BMX
MEYVELGSLDHYLEENEKTLIPNDLELMCLQVANGMEYLHSHNILHNDLATRNVLVSKDEKGELCVKVSDFGLSFISEQKYDYVYNNDSGKLPFRYVFFFDIAHSLEFFCKKQ